MKDDFTKTKEILESETRSDSPLTTHSSLSRQRRETKSFREGVFTGDSAAAPRRGGGAPFQDTGNARAECPSDHTFPEKVWMIFSTATMFKAMEYVETWSG